MKKALILLNDKINSNGWDAKFVANVHDEWQIECHADHAKAVGRSEEHTSELQSH